MSDKVFVTLNQALIQGCIEVQGVLPYEWLKGENVYYHKVARSSTFWLVARFGKYYPLICKKKSTVASPSLVPQSFCVTMI